MTDAEIIALAALVNADVAEVTAANQDREHRGEAMAYTGFYSEHYETIVAELKRRKAERATTAHTAAPCNCGVCSECNWAQNRE